MAGFRVKMCRTVLNTVEYKTFPPTHSEIVLSNPLKELTARFEVLHPHFSLMPIISKRTKCFSILSIGNKSRRLDLQIHVWSSWMQDWKVIFYWSSKSRALVVSFRGLCIIISILQVQMQGQKIQRPFGYVAEAFGAKSPSIWSFGCHVSKCGLNDVILISNGAILPPITSVQTMIWPHPWIIKLKIIGIIVDDSWMMDGARE